MSAGNRDIRRFMNLSKISQEMPISIMYVIRTIGMIGIKSVGIKPLDHLEHNLQLYRRNKVV